jgi:hypothetical protein
MIEEETSTKTPQTWTLDSHQNLSSNFVNSLYKYGVSNGRQSTPELQPKTQIIIRSSNPSDEEAIEELELNEKVFFFRFFLSFFLSVQPPSIHSSSMSWWLLINHYGWKMGALYLVLDHKNF